MSIELRIALTKTRELLVIAQDPQVSQNMILEARKLISKALAEPLRNCDVGTAEEQTERANNYCAQFEEVDGRCVGCPLDDDSNDYTLCICRWAQMPYEEVKNATNSQNEIAIV